MSAGDGPGDGSGGGGGGDAGDGSGGGAGDGAGGKPPVAADWLTLRTSLPAELRDHPILKPYSEGDSPSGLQGLVQAHVDVQRLVGAKGTVVPGESSTIQDWARHYKELGRPDTPQGYDFGDFKPMEGVPWDKALEAGLIEDLHEMGATNPQANLIMRRYAGRTGAQYQAAVKQLEEASKAADEELHAEWGATYDANLEVADRVFETAFGDDIQAIANVRLPDGTPLGESPIFVRGMYELGSRMAEGKLVDGKVVRGLTPAAAQAEINKMEGDPAMVAILAAPSHPEHSALMKQHTALYQAANPEA
jgi:hypothetical protein